MTASPNTGGIPLLGKLPFVALGRVEDATTLATWHNSPQNGASDRELFSKLLVASQKRLEPGQRTRLKQQQGGSVCCMQDAKGMLVVCLTTTTLSYPERLAFSLLQELLAYVYEEMGDGEAGATAERIAALPANGLQATLNDRMHELVVKYEDPAQADQHMQTMGQMDKVTSVMQKNLASVTDNKESADELNNKVHRLRSGAGDLDNEADALTERLQRRNWWLSPKGIATVAVTATVATVLTWEFVL